MATLKHVHLVGIGGAGMSALARLYLQQGLRVTGTDAEESRALADLRALGATVLAGHHPSLIGDAGLVVHSSAVPATDPELVEALERGVPLLKHAQALGQLFNTRRGIAVAGSHGKTTTTSMISFILDRAGLRPSFQVGGELVDLGTSARWDRGEWMVIEADEFDRRFLEYRPEVAVVTNVEPDHFEYYHSVAEMEGAFAAFLDLVSPQGWIVACGQEPRLARLLDAAGQRRVILYGIPAGIRPDARWQVWASDVAQRPGGSRFRVHRAGEAAPVDAELVIPGRHNVLNSLAAVAASGIAGVPAEQAVDILRGFHGAERRFQLAADVEGVRIYVDYAHHPTEVRVNVEAARSLVSGGGRLWAVFQPHLRVRTEMLFDEFARAFDGADRVVLTDVYSPAGREPEGSYRGSAELLQAMAHPSATHVPGLPDARRLLAAELRAGDVALVMGAGPIYQLGQQVAGDLRARYGAAGG